MTQTPALIAFHGKPEVKAQCLARLEAELASDIWNLDTWRNSDEIGIPKWLCYFAEKVTRWPSPKWSRDFLRAVPVGSDLDAIKGPFLVFVLGCARGVVEANHTDVLAVMDRSIALWKRSDIASDNWLNEAGAAQAAAIAAANAAATRPSWRAALAAAMAAEAAERADAVVKTMENAFQAAERAREAAGADLPLYDYGNFSDELLHLMKTPREWQQPST
jgi:hypothetical protein